jgi:hypothetical protein
MLRLAHLPGINNPNNIWQKLQIVKLLTVQLPPASRYFLLPRPVLFVPGIVTAMCYMVRV